MSDKDLVRRTCPHCGNYTVFEIKGECTQTLSAFDENYPEPSFITDKDRAEMRAKRVEIAYARKDIFAQCLITWKLMRCMSCSQPELEQTNRYEALGQPTIDEHYTLYPINKKAKTPRHATDMPKDVAQDFNEARAVFGSSPRSSAALLRLALQKLCKHFGMPGKHLNEDIATLVKKGLPPGVQKALDLVRVIGNNAVHPGEIDLRDDHETALELFKLINYIVEVMITRPRTIEVMFDKLPQSKLKEIEKRDQA